MNIKPLLIETVLAGAIHLTWLTLLTLCILGKSPETILDSFATIEPGTAAILVVVFFSISFFFGRIAEHFIIALNFCRKNKVDKIKTLKSFEGSRGEIWVNKIFSFSSACGLLLLGLMSYIQVESSNSKRAILVVGIILITGTVISFLFWNYLEKKVN